MPRYRVAVLASGEGTNLQGLIDQVHRPGIAEIVAVLSDKSGAGALRRAASAGIFSRGLPHQSGEGRRSYHRRLADVLVPHQPDLVVLAGYMRLLPKEFLRRFSPVINVHPSLLPAFPGLDAPGQAIARGVKVSGCTVHLVDGGMDTGPILMQRALDVESGEAAKELHARIKVLERQCLVAVVTALAQGKLKLEGLLNSEEDCRGDKESAAQCIR